MTTGASRPPRNADDGYRKHDEALEQWLAACARVGELAREWRAIAEDLDARARADIAEAKRIMGNALPRGHRAPDPGPPARGDQAC